MDSLTTLVVLVHFGLDIAHEIDEGLNDLPLVGSNILVHHLDLGFGVRFDPRRDVALGSGESRFVLSELLLAFGLVLLDLGLRLLLRLLQTTVLALASFGYLRIQRKSWGFPRICQKSSWVGLSNNILRKTKKVFTSKRTWSLTFSAARFSAASSCWIPWVWLAISIQNDLVTAYKTPCWQVTGSIAVKMAL